MKLSKGIQFFAPEPGTDYTVTINFDSGVESVYCQTTNDLGNTLMTWTTSGTQTFSVNYGLRYFVNLKSDYSLKTVTSNKGSITNITETTFDPIDTTSTYTLNITTEFTGTQTTYDLTNLNLSAGNYAITVVAEAEGFTDSDVSNSVNYTVQAQLAAPTIAMNADGKTLEITDVEDAQSYKIYANGVVVGNVNKCIPVRFIHGTWIDNRISAYIKVNGNVSTTNYDYIMTSNDSYIDIDGAVGGYITIIESEGSLYCLSVTPTGMTYDTGRFDNIVSGASAVISYEVT